MPRLPAGWAMSSLGEVCTKPQYGWTSKADKKGDLKLLRTTDISKGAIDWDNVPYCLKRPDNVEKYQLQGDDILVSRAGSVGISTRIVETPCDTVFASYLIRFKPLNGIHPKYVELYLKTNGYWKSISEFSAGIAVPNVNASKLANLRIPIAPVNEQHRIVAKLEKLLAKVDKCKERLDKIPAILKRFRQSVLAAACSGRLTADWRQRNPNVEPASELLTRILTNKHPRNSGRFVNNESYHDNLPETWTQCSLGSLCLLITKGSSPKWQGINYVSNGVLFITSENVVSGHLNLENKKYVEEGFNAIQQRSILEKGDLLTNIVGASIGRSAVFNFDETANINQAVALIRLHSDMNRTYILNVLNSPAIIDFMNRSKVDVARANLSLKDVSSLPIPLPPSSEQLEIICRLEALFQVVDRIEERYQNANAHIAKLTQSVLAKAFRGELVPQDPSDEPAAKLLERVRAERETIQAKTSGKRRARTGRERTVRKKGEESKEAEFDPIHVRASNKSPARSPKKRTSRKTSETRPAPLDSIETNEVMAAFRKACRGRGAMSREELIKEVSQVLGYRLLGSVIAERLKGHLRAAIRRGIVEANSEWVQPATRTIEDYDRGRLVEAMRSVMQTGKEYPRDEVIRATAEYLGFSRVTANVDTVMRSAIRVAIRQGDIVSDRDVIWRI